MAESGGAGIALPANIALSTLPSKNWCMYARINRKWWGPIGFTGIAVALVAGWVGWLFYTDSNNVINFQMRRGVAVVQHLRTRDPGSNYEVRLAVDDLRPEKTPDFLASSLALKENQPTPVQVEIWSQSHPISIIKQKECCIFSKLPDGTRSLSMVIGRVKMAPLGQYQLRALVIAPDASIAGLHPRLEVSPPTTEDWMVESLLIFTLAALLEAISVIWALILLGRQYVARSRGEVG
jgi:hypothetical protein